MMLGRKNETKIADSLEGVRLAATEKGAAVVAGVDDVLGALAGKVSEAREKVATMTGDGAKAARKALDGAMKETRNAAKQLDKRWQKLDSRQKGLVVGGLLAAVAAALAAPSIMRKMKGTKKKRR
jgi:hypothetical protein